MDIYLYNCRLPVAREKEVRKGSKKLKKELFWFVFVKKLHSVPSGMPAGTPIERRTGN